MQNEGMATDDTWIWDGGRVCLDFTDALRFRWRTTPTETLRNPDDLARWLQQAGLLAPGAPNPTAAAALTSGRRLRETVDRAVLAVTDGRLPASADVTVLDRAAADAPRPALRIAIKDGRLGARRHHEHRHRCRSRAGTDRPGRRRSAPVRRDPARTRLRRDPVRPALPGPFPRPQPPLVLHVPLRQPHKGPPPPGPGQDGAKTRRETKDLPGRSCRRRGAWHAHLRRCRHSPPLSASLDRGDPHHPAHRRSKTPPLSCDLIGRTGPSRTAGSRRDRVRLSQRPSYGRRGRGGSRCPPSAPGGPVRSRSGRRRVRRIRGVA